MTSDNQPKLVDVVNEIMNDLTMIPGKAKTAKYTTRYPEIFERYPSIINKVTQETEFDVDRLLWMIGVLQRVEDNSMSKHEADIEVGEKLVDVHVKPLLSPTKATKQD